MILILAISTIAIAIGIILNEYDLLNEMFNISSTNLNALRDFLRQYIAGMPIPPNVT